MTYNLRYYPLCQEAHWLVKNGAIGEPRIVHGMYLQDWLFYPNDWNWRLDPGLGGTMRAVADIGTHWMDLICWITGRKLTELCADMATVIPVRQRPKGPVETFQKNADTATEPVQMTTDDYGSILLHFEGRPAGSSDRIADERRAQESECGSRLMARKARWHGTRSSLMSSGSAAAKKLIAG